MHATLGIEGKEEHPGCPSWELRLVRHPDTWGLFQRSQDQNRPAAHVRHRDLLSVKPDHNNFLFSSSVFLKVFSLWVLPFSLLGLQTLCKLLSSLHTQRNKPHHNNNLWKSRNLSQDHGVSIKVTGGQHLCHKQRGRQTGRKVWEKELAVETTWWFISTNKKVLQTLFLPFSNKWLVTNNKGLSKTKQTKHLISGISASENKILNPSVSKFLLLLKTTTSSSLRYFYSNVAGIKWQDKKLTNLSPKEKPVYHDLEEKLSCSAPSWEKPA